MAITHSLNWMGPVTMDWYRKRGLTRNDGQFEIITTNYCGGRIDIRGLDNEEYYSGWHEYALPIMHEEDWNSLSIWLKTFKSKELVSYDDLIELFEKDYGKKIRWD